MFCSGITQCYFCICTESDLFYEKILYDDNFFKVNMITKITKFYFLTLLPEIIMKNY
jgi:hypothetical protein